MLAIKQKRFITGVDDSMNALAQHRRTAGPKSRAELYDGNEKISRDSDVNCLSGLLPGRLQNGSHCVLLRTTLSEATLIEFIAAYPPWGRTRPAFLALASRPAQRIESHGVACSWLPAGAAGSA